MFWKKGGTVFWLFCGIGEEQSLVFCVIIRRPLFIILPFFPFGLPDYPVHIFKLFLICNQIVENKYIIVKIRHIESDILRACMLVCQEFRFRFVRNNVFWSWNIICVISNVELVIKNSVLEKGIGYAKKKKNRVWNCILRNDQVLYDIINNQNMFLL
jgi:hypothetical protein